METQYYITYTYELPTTTYYGETRVRAASQREAAGTAERNILRKVPSARNFQVTLVVEEVRR